MNIATNTEFNADTELNADTGLTTATQSDTASENTENISETAALENFIPSEFLHNAEAAADKEKPNAQKSGTLFLVSSHIGNSEDMTARAVKTLKMADVVVGEEGKTVARLLHENKITKKLEELNEHNEATQTGALLTLLQQGKSLALVSDAGTPLFADPGAQLVRRCIEKGIAIKAVPGASSIMTALVTSGLPMDSFVFAGFVSREPAERIQELKRLADEPRTVVLLETPYRLVPLLEAARQIMPTRRAYLGCNLTMDTETHHYGTVSELYTKFLVLRFKGEFVFCFEGDKNATKSSAKYSAPAEARSERRFEPRGERSFEKKSFGDKKFGDRKFGDKKFGDRKFGDKKFGERNFTDRKFEAKRFEDRSEPRGEAPDGEKKFGDKNFGDKKFGEKRFGERKFEDRRGDRSFGEKKFGDKKFGDKKFGERKFDDRRGDRSFGDKKFGERKFDDKGGDRSFGEKKFGDRKFDDKRGDRSFGDKKFGDRKFGDKKFGDNKFGDRKFGDKKFGDKKFGDKKFGDKKFGDRKFADKKFDKPNDKPSNDAPDAKD